MLQACMQVSSGCLQQLVTLPALVELNARPFIEDALAHPGYIDWVPRTLTLSADLQEVQVAFETAGRSLRWRVLPSE